MNESVELFPFDFGEFHDQAFVHLDVKPVVEEVRVTLADFGVELVRPWKTPMKRRGGDAVRARFESWGTGQRPTILYWVGHGWAQHPIAELAHADSPAVVDGWGVTPRLMARAISKWEAKAPDSAWLLVVIDACQSGRFAELLQAELDNLRGPRRIAILGTSTSASTNLGEFSRELSAALKHTFAANTTISVEQLVNELSRTLRGKRRLLEIDPTAGLRRSLPALEGFAGALDARGELLAVIADLPEDERLHFFAKAQGGELRSDGTVMGEISWNFVGREDERATLVERLSRDGLTVVTGRAGSGKSAVLGDLVVRSRPDLASVMVAHGLMQYVFAKVPALDAAIQLTGLNARGMADRLCAALSIAPAEPERPLTEHLDQELRRLGSASRPIRIVVDALDEAVAPLEVASLLRHIGLTPHVRLIVGTRRSTHEGPDLPDTNDRDLLDVLEAADSDIVQVQRNPQLVFQYVQRRLRPATSLSNDEAEIWARRIASVDQEFLYARLVTFELLEDETLLRRPAAAERLGTTHRAVFAATVERLKAKNRSYEPLLIALAVAEGRGLPIRDGVWAAVGRAVGGRAVSDQEIPRLLVDAAPYITLDVEDEQTVYRLGHRTFAEHLVATAKDATNLDQHLHFDVESKQMRAVIGDALWELTKDAGGWPLANPYVVRYLLRYVDPHATDKLIDICTDPQYLHRAIAILGVNATGRILDIARTDAPVPAIVAVAKVVRRARVALFHEPGQLAGQLIARLGSELDRDLEKLVESAPTIAPRVWLKPVNVRLDWSAELNTTQTVTGKVRAITSGVLDTEPVLVLGAGESIMLWDPRHGEVGAHGQVRGIIGNDGLRPIAVALGELDGQPVVAAATYECSITVRNVRSQQPVAVFDGGPQGWSLALASGPLTHVKGQSLAGMGIHSRMLDEHTAVYWSGEPGQLCSLNRSLGVVTATNTGFRLECDAVPQDLEFTLGDGHHAVRPVLTVGQFAGETILAVVEGDNVRVVHPDGTGVPPQWVQFGFQIRCLALTWADSGPHVAAANDPENHSGVQSYVTIRKPTDTSESTQQPVLQIIGAGSWMGRLVVVTQGGTVHDVLLDTALIDASPDEVEVTVGTVRAGRDPSGKSQAWRATAKAFATFAGAHMVRPVRAGRGTSAKSQAWPATAKTFATWAGAHVEVRGSFEGVIWVWSADSGRFIAGPYTAKPLTDGEFHNHKGGDLDAVTALTMGQVGEATWIVAADISSLTIYDAATGLQLPAPSVAPDIQALALGTIADRSLMATGSKGGAVSIWDTATWKRLAGFTMDDPVTGIWLVGHQVIVQTGGMPLSCLEVCGLS